MIERAEEVFLEAIEKNPKKPWAYTYAGRFYRNIKRYDRAEEILKKATQQDSKQRETHLELGIMLRQLGRYQDAIRVLDQAVTVAVGKGRGLLEKGFCLYALEQAEDAWNVFAKAVDEDHRLYQNLIEWFIEREEYLQIENFLLAEKKKYPKKWEIDINLVMLYEQWGREDLARNYYSGIRARKKMVYYQSTIKNYTHLVDHVRSRDIPLIAVQYPVRSVVPLKELLKEHDVLDFVDNQKTFVEALKKSSFKDYFEDSFAGDFGHCSPKGNALLADNVATVILKHFDH